MKNVYILSVALKNFLSYLYGDNKIDMPIKAHNESNKTEKEKLVCSLKHSVKHDTSGKVKKLDTRIHSLHRAFTLHRNPVITRFRAKPS